MKVTSPPPAPLKGETTVPNGSTGNPPNNFQLAWQALLLNENAYDAVSKTKSPFRKGLTILFIILLTVGVAQSIGLAFDVLTTPRIDLVQEAILQALTKASWYQAAVVETTDFATSFDQMYTLSWQLLRIMGGVPSWLGTATSFIVRLIFSLLSWLIYGWVAYLIARWLGGQAKWSLFLGALGLAYAPMLLAVANLVPGLAVPGSLIAGWLLITKYQAVKNTHKLSWEHSLAVVVVPYLVIGLVLFGVVLLGGASALSQIPGLDAILSLLGGG